MKTTSPVSSDLQMSSHFWVSVGRGAVVNPSLGPERVGRAQTTTAQGPCRKLQVQLWAVGGALGLGLKIPAVSLIY